MNTMTTTAERILRDAFARAPEAAACRPGPAGQPSRLADTLMSLAEQTGSTCEFRVTPDEYSQMVSDAPDVLWHRAVYRLADGSFLAVHDTGADIAPSERYVLRHADGQFAGVWDGESAASFARTMNQALARLGPLDDPDLAADTARSISFQGMEGVLPDRDDLRGVIAVGTDGTAIMATERGIAVVPGSAADIREQLAHAYACMDRMEAALGIPREEALAEINPLVRAMVDGMNAWERESHISPQASLHEFRPRH